ncbi:hypothetical protein C7974DRAFT_138678 [Boeremia exigua]|uniref:uncharacterized protein n=1 Tax=Boeremia exigua TaxID=749465 RepID=UPI001E8E3A5F|nr:uncharacterized protein C7974DRAFT_138678 [Boeremia exigua]KAH6639769.1 hypothetical protein C7974DRAFT_138678 [Boeremia exigua]
MYGSPKSARRRAFFFKSLAADFALSAANMFEQGARVLLAPCPLPLPDFPVLAHCRNAPSSPTHSDRTAKSSRREGETMSDLPDARLGLYVPFGSKSECLETSGLASMSSTLYEFGCRRAAVSLDLDRRLPPTGEAMSGQVEQSHSIAQLRGGEGQPQTGMFRWFKKARSSDRTQSSFPTVTYKGKRIGSPHLIPALNVLPPASRYVPPQKVSPFSRSTRASLNNYQDNVKKSLDTSHHNHGASFLSPPALLATPSRPATSNPFAGIYGNPDMRRAGPVSLPVDNTTASSLVGRPSALDGSQTGYAQPPAIPDRSPLRKSGEAPQHTRQAVYGSAQSSSPKAWADRKWDALPALPTATGGETPEPIQMYDTAWMQGAKDEPFDTEEVLGSLRPERLGLHPLQGRCVDGRGDTGRDTATLPAQAAASDTGKLAQDPAILPAQATASDATKLVRGSEQVKATDNLSTLTRDWDLQSCDTDDLGVDKLVEKQERRARRAQRTLSLRSPPPQLRQANVRDNNEPLNGLPEEDAPTAESLFYADFVGIVKDYREQLHRIIQRAYEAGDISEDQWVREKWRHKTSMERRLRAAEEMSGYRVRPPQTQDSWTRENYD